jgi:hypothetical protein
VWTIGKDTALAAGDYSIITNGKKIDGHFFQTLKQTTGNWEIAEHFFARTDPITASEANAYRGN